MKKSHLPLIVGILLPIIFIIIVSIAIFVPSLSVDPQHDFVYSAENSYYSYSNEYRNTYKVVNGRIALEPMPYRENMIYKGDMPDLYRYNIRTFTTHKISLEEAKSLNLDPGPSSPDGYSVAYEYGHSGIFELFGSNSEDDGYFISKGRGKKKLPGLPVDGYYRNPGSFKFIGWIK